jgi:osmotically-inducible protein OsmY
VSRVIKRLPRAAVAVGLLCGLLACASGPPKTEAQREADRVTAERVEAALSADRTMYAKHITVHADNGVVYLTGYVWDRPDFDEAASIAESVPGVTRVVNDLEFQRNGSDNNPVAR